MRVLFVVPSSYWITAEEAHQIMKHNPDIRGILCSVPVLNELLGRAPYLSENIDLVHFMVPVAGRRHLDKFLGRVPCVTTIYHIEPSYSPEAITSNAKADCIMIISEMWRSELISRGVPAERIFNMPNGVDTSIFRPPIGSERAQIRKNMSFTPDETVIGFSGQPGRDNGWRKGLDVFIEALKNLAEQGIRVGVVVGGPGWGTAITKIRAMGIKVYQRPYVLRAEDGAPMYRALDFFWVTSRIEGGPAPLMEAMSSGVCCISTKVGIAPEIIKDGINGCLVNIEDANGIANVTRNLMERTEEREMMGYKARNTIVSGYDWSKTAKKAAELYQTAMNNFEQRFSVGRKREVGSDMDGSDFLSPRDAKWLEVQERLVWSRELCRMGERRAAFSLGWRTSLMHPFSMRTWSFLVNLIKPAPVLI